MKVRNLTLKPHYPKTFEDRLAASEPSVAKVAAWFQGKGLHVYWPELEINGPDKGDLFVWKPDTDTVDMIEVKHRQLDFPPFTLPTMIVDPVTLQTEDADIFAGGDAVSGPATVVEAIAAGKHAAESIRRYLCQEDMIAGRDEPLAVVEDVDISEAVPVARQRRGRRHSDAKLAHG